MWSSKSSFNLYLGLTIKIYQKNIKCFSLYSSWSSDSPSLNPTYSGLLLVCCVPGWNRSLWWWVGGSLSGWVLFGTLWDDFCSVLLFSCSEKHTDWENFLFFHHVFFPTLSSLNSLPTFSFHSTPHYLPPSLPPSPLSINSVPLSSGVKWHAIPEFDRF